MSPEERNRLLEEALFYHRSNEFDRAEAIYKRVREACPREFDPWFLSGAMAFQRGGHLDFSIELLEKAKRINPFSDSCRLFLGMAYADRGRFADAEPLLARALKTLPQYHEAWENLGLSQMYLGMFEQAANSFRQAIKLQPKQAKYHMELGEALMRTNQFAAAEQHFRDALSLDPGLAEAWNNLGICLMEQPGRLGEGMQAIEKALELLPERSEFKGNRFMGLLKLFRVEEAYDFIKQTTRGFFARPQELSAYCCLLNYLPEKSRQEIFDEHVNYGISILSFSSVRFENDPEPEKKLRVGFVSADLRRHSIAFFLFPILKRLDPRRFSAYLYFTGYREDLVSEEFKRYSSKWLNVSMMPDEDVIEAIKKDGLDVIFDLTGHDNHNRLPIFGECLAPVQVTFLGYPNTTGLTSIHYRFVDGVTDPPGAEQFATEELVRFSECAWCYEAPENAPEPRMPAEGAPLTLGSFNNFLKVNKVILGVWKRVLDALPEARLVLKSRNLGDPDARVVAEQRIREAGIDLSRVELREMVEDFAEHLAMYSEIDVALDTFPYNGTTTTCEALWMGVPVVTLVGERHCSRVGLSLLKAVGHEEWAAQSEEEYVEKVVGLAKDRAKREEIRRTLRGEVAASRLCNAEAYVEDFCSAVRRLWQDWCKKQTLG